MRFPQGTWGSMGRHAEDDADRRACDRVDGCSRGHPSAEPPFQRLSRRYLQIAAVCQERRRLTNVRPASPSAKRERLIGSGTDGGVVVSTANVLKIKSNGLVGGPAVLA